MLELRNGACKKLKPTFAHDRLSFETANQMTKSKRNFSARLKQRFPNFEKEWIKLINEFGTEMVNLIKDRLSGEYSFLKELSQFRFKIIVDNNFIFSQIKGAIRKKK